jgi:hypothetical protein
MSAEKNVQSKFVFSMLASGLLVEFGDQIPLSPLPARKGGRNGEGASRGV